MDDILRKNADPHSRLRDEDGITLVEVLVSIMLVGLIAMSFLGLDAAGRTSADQRRVAQATQVAQADQERLRGLSADQLAGLNQTRSVTVDGTTYTVTSTGKYTSASSGAESCASSAASADYAKVTSSVTWPNNKRNPVAETSLITPRIGGSLVVQAQDQGANGLPGATVTATGTDNSNSNVVRSGTTDSGGCVIFGSLPVGGYSVVTSLAGYVDSSGSATPTSSVTTTAGNTTNLTVRLAAPGRILATFLGVTGSNPNGYASTAPSMSWSNPGLLTPGVLDPSSDANTSLDTGQTVFPYITSGTSTFDNNYVVWAGSCTSAQPPTSSQSTATVTPGGTATSTANGQVAVKMPVINLTVTYGGSAVKPDHVTLRDACNDTWDAPIASSSSKPSSGWLASPGQPYGSGYTVCADYAYSSSWWGTSYRKDTASVSNNSFNASNGNSVTVSISSGWGSSSGTC